MPLAQYVIDQINGRGGKAGYRHANGETIEEAAHVVAAGLIAQLNDRTASWDSYDAGTRRHVEYVLAGGGPGYSFHAVYDTEGDLDHAYLEYLEPGGSAVVKFPAWAAEQLAELFECPPEPVTVRYEFAELGEGRFGEYDPDDPDDVEYLRLDYMENNEEVESACTGLPVSLTAGQQEQALAMVTESARRHPALSPGRLVELFSNADETWLDTGVPEQYLTLFNVNESEG